MASQVTRIEDVIQPELFAQYLSEKTVEKSVLIRSGMVEENAQLDSFAASGGTVFTAPSWGDLDGESEPLDDTSPIETDKITASAEMITKLIRKKGWGEHDLSGALAGSDPMRVILEKVSDWEVRDENRIVINILKGIFGKPTGEEKTGLEDLILDASTEVVTGDMILDGKQLLGDNAGILSLLYMHSAVYTELQKQNLAKTITIPQSDGKVDIKTFLDYEVITDDSCPCEGVGKNRVYSTFLLARGAFQRGQGRPADLVEVETERDAKYSTDNLYLRRSKILHPRGLSWVGAANIPKPTPRNEDLANADNWKLAKELKKIGMVKIMHKLGA